MSTCEMRWVKTSLLNVRVNNDRFRSSRLLWSSVANGDKSLPSICLEILIACPDRYEISVASSLICPIFLNTFSKLLSCFRWYLLKSSSMDFDRLKRLLNERLCRAFFLISQFNEFQKLSSLDMLELYQ